MRFSIFKIINSFAGKSKYLDFSAIFLARTLPYLMVLALAVISLFLKSFGIIFFPLLSALISRFIITQTVHFFYKRERPFKTGKTKLLIPAPKTPSFPSGHASFFFGLSLPIFFYSIPLGIIFFIFACLNALARVFCGVHWSLDTVAGFAAGLISTIIVYYLKILI